MNHEEIKKLLAKYAAHNDGYIFLGLVDMDEMSAVYVDYNGTEDDFITMLVYIMKQDKTFKKCVVQSLLACNAQDN